MSQLFSQPLEVRAVDSDGNNVEGVRVDFTATNSGASATFDTGFAITNADGIASIIPRANDVVGSYVVVASSFDSNEVMFNLSNESDQDSDGIPDYLDNCPEDANTNQSDIDEDLFGDACDSDIDGDLIDNADDNCPLNANPDQADENPDTPEGDLCELADELCLPTKTQNNKIVVICLWLNI